MKADKNLPYEKLKKYFVTSSNRQTWGEKEEILFASSACLKANFSNSPENQKFSFVEDKWQDHKTLHSDIEYLDNIYEKLLKLITQTLNEHHSVRHSVRYWRILLGPWLYLFIQTLYGKWQKCLVAGTSHETYHTIILDYDLTDFIPCSLREMDPENDMWSHLIFSKIIKEQNFIKPITISAGLIPEKSKSLTVGKRSRIKKRLVTLAQLWSAFMVRKDEIMIIDSCLGISFDIRLYLSLKQIPRFWKSPPSPFIPANQKDRKLFKDCLIENFKVDKDIFYTFLVKMIGDQVPTVYLEGYSDLLKLVASLNWPLRPRAILTSNAFQFDDVFQAYAAEKTENGTKLVVGQHGGFYGVGRKVVGEDHQVRISDRFISWGWKSDNASVYSGFIFANPSSIKGKWDNNGHALLVTVPWRRTEYKLSSMPINSEQSKQFLDDQLRLAQCLPKRIRYKLIVRISDIKDKKLNTDYIPGWKTTYPEVEIDPCIKSVGEQVKQSRLVISNYNSTGILETLSGNIPTIIFWRPERFHLRECSLKYFEEFESVGIYHRTPESTAEFINKIWDNVDSWWNSLEVQKAREEFVEVYCRKVNNPVKLIKSSLTDWNQDNQGL